MLCLRSAIAALALAVLCTPASGQGTPTPAPLPSPTAIGVLGNTQIDGRVHDASRGADFGIAAAKVDYLQISSRGGQGSGSVSADNAGLFGFALYLYDSDLVSITASAPGFATESYDFTGVDAAYDFLRIGLVPLGGTLEVAPAELLSLGCGGEAEVIVRNAEPLGGEPLVVAEILPFLGTQGPFFGGGFEWNLDHIDLPATLQPGESLAFPVRYDSAGQSRPSLLFVGLRSGARNGDEPRAVYRGEIDGCGTPTPTATATPSPPPPCSGDCDGDGSVDHVELRQAVELALAGTAVGCTRADRDQSEAIEVDELVTAVVCASGARRSPALSRFFRCGLSLAAHGALPHL